MIFVVNKSLNTYYNMAAEEFFLDRCVDDVLMLWQNKNTIVVGKNQNTLSEINVDYVKEQGIDVVRRLTGGGAMYQDIGNLNFTYIFNNSGEWFSDFSRFTDPVIRALKNIGVPAELSGRNDITVDGKKISGNAQTVRGNRIMHHGTLLLNSDVSVLSKALRPDREKIKSKGIASVSSRVANINDFLSAPLSIDKIIDVIRKSIVQEHPELINYEISESDSRQIEKLALEKYSTWEWNYGYSPKYDFFKKVKCSGGIIECSFQVKNGTITAAKINGDFFGYADVSEIEGALIGIKHNPDEIRRALEKFDLNSYFMGIKIEELIPVMF